MEEKSIKEVEDSRTSCSHLLFPRHLNAYGKLFGGQLLEWIDELAGIVAMRHSNSFVVTANMSNVQFHSSAEATEILYMEGYVCMVGNCSMELVIRSFAEKVNGERRLASTSYATMVAVDETGKPKAVPKLRISEDIRNDYEEALKRHKKRKNNVAEN